MKKYENLGNTENYICPLCEENQVKLIKVEKNNQDCIEHTYIWACELCPHISFEFWDNEDLENLNLYMNNKLEEIKGDE